MADSLIFDGVDDRIVFSSGRWSGDVLVGASQELTVAVIAKITSDSAGYKKFVGVNALDSLFGTNNTSPKKMDYFGGGGAGVTAATLQVVAADGWCVYVYSLGPLSDASRFHKMPFSSGTWQHETNASHPNTPTVTSISIGSDGTSSQFVDCNMLLAGFWDRELTDGEIETLNDGLNAWVEMLPDELLRFDRVSPIRSLTGTAAETSRTGTTLDPGDAPEGGWDASVRGRRYKRFVGPTALSSTPETLYTVPYNGRSVIRNIYANNPSSVDAALTLGIALPDAYADEVLADSPAAYYRLNEGTYPFLDLSGNGNDSVDDAVSLVYREPGLISSDPNDTSMGFNGTDSWIRIADDATLDITTELTIEAWINPTSLGDYEAILAKYPGDNTSGYELYVMANGALNFTRRSGGTNHEHITNAGDVTVGSTYHVVAVYEGAATDLAYVYVNGIMVADSTNAQTLAANTSLLSIGARSNDGIGDPNQAWFDGRIDEVAVYPTALSAERIAAHYEAGQAPDGIFDEDTVPAGDILFARRDTNYVLEAGEILQGFATAGFPSTSVLDDFNRADNASSLGGNWTSGVESGYSSLGVLSNQAYANGGFQGNYWSASIFGADQEAYATLPVVPVYRFRLYVRLTDPGGSFNAYSVNVLNTGIIETAIATVAGSGTYLTPTGGPGGTFVAGDSIGMRIIGTTLSVWLKHAGVWTEIYTYTDSSVTGAGYIGMHVGDETTVRIDDFGGGAIVMPVLVVDGVEYGL